MRKLIGHAILTCIALMLITPLSETGLGAQEASPAASEASEAPPALFSVRPAGDSERSFVENLEIAPGESVSLEAQVLNNGEGALDLRVFKANATNAVNGGMQVGQEEDEEVGLTGWLDLSPQEVALSPDQKAFVAYTITVPETAEPGQYVSSIVAATVNTMPIPGSEMFDHRIRFAMTVSIVVPGEIEHSFVLGDPFLDENRLIIPIENTGNFLVKPEGILELKDPEGQVILSAPIQLNSVYGGLSTTIEIGLSSQLPGDDYTLTLELADPLSGSEAYIIDQPITVIEPEEPADFELVSSAVVPNDEEIVFANIDVTISSKSHQIPYSTVILEVTHDGEVVEEFPLATNQVLLSGDNTFSARYIPTNLWEPGIYTFKIIVNSVNPETGLQVLLLEQELDAEIVVP